MEVDITLSAMVGKTIVRVSPVEVGTEVMLFLMSDGSAYGFHHHQDCCESVSIADVCGDMDDLIGTPLLQVEEASSTDGTTTDPFTLQECKVEYEDSQTWTFYKFATIRGSVTIRWLGESNGYYSEDVDVTVYNAAADMPHEFRRLAA